MDLVTSVFLDISYGFLKIDYGKKVFELLNILVGLWCPYLRLDLTHILRCGHLPLPTYPVENRKYFLTKVLNNSVVTLELETVNQVKAVFYEAVHK